MLLTEKYNRLAWMLADNGGASIGEVASKLNVGIKTVRGMIDHLRRKGLHVVNVRRRTGVFQLVPQS